MRRTPTPLARGRGRPHGDTSCRGLAATLRAAVDGDDVADPVVVATAQVTGATVVSSDGDIARLTGHKHPVTATVDPRI